MSSQSYYVHYFQCVHTKSTHIFAFVGSLAPLFLPSNTQRVLVAIVQSDVNLNVTKGLRNEKRLECWRFRIRNGDFVLYVLWPFCDTLFFSKLHKSWFLPLPSCTQLVKDRKSHGTCFYEVSKQPPRQFAVEGNFCVMRPEKIYRDVNTTSAQSPIFRLLSLWIHPCLQSHAIVMQGSKKSL